MNFASEYPESRIQTALPGFWESVWKLLRLRLVILSSGFRRARLRTKIATVVFGLVLLAGTGFIFFISWIVLRFLRDPALATALGDMTPLLESVPVVIVGAAFLGILLTSFGVLLQALYLAGDMDFLLSAPLPIRAVFVAKLLQAILPNFAMICLFSLPILFGFGITSGYNWLYYPLVILVLVALALAAAGLASLLVMLVVRIFPARRVAEVLGFFGAVFSILCSQSGQLANYSDFSDQQAAQTISLLARLDQPWSPLAWAGRGLTYIGSGHWLPGLGYFILTISLTMIVFMLTLRTAEGLYYSGWASLQGQKRKKKAVQPVRNRERILPERWLSWIPSSTRAIVSKDFLMIRRDLRQMSNLITPLIFGVVYAFMFLRTGGEAPAGRGEAPEMFMQSLETFMLYGNVALALLVGWMLVSGMGRMSFSQEGKHYWLLKSAPISSRSLVSAKFLVTYLPALFLGWIFLAGISLIQQVNIFFVLYSFAVVGMTIAGNVGISLSFGIAGATFNWEDPRQMTRMSGGCLMLIISFFFMSLVLGLFFSPLVMADMFGWAPVLGPLVGLLSGGTTCLIFIIFPLRMVFRRVAHLAEE